MNVACPSCQTRYSVEDSRIPPSGVTIKCPKCTHSFVVKRDGEPPRDASAVALPGQRQGAVPLPGQTAGAVPLPGGGQGIPEAATDPTIGGPSRGAPLAQSGVLNFIDDTAQRAGVPHTSGASGASELRVRKMNGMIEGPFGVQRIVTMVRNGDLQGNEEISEDGRTWRAMTTHPDLGRVIGDMRSRRDDGLSFTDLPAPAGPADLPGLPSKDRDVPAPNDLPGPRGATRPAAAPATAPASFGGGFGGGLGGPAPAQPTSGSQPIGGALGGRAGLGADLGGSGPTPMPGGAPSNGSGGPSLGSVGGIDPSLLEVGEIPQLPSIWEQYRKPIVIFAVALVVAFIGLATALWTDAGLFGYKAIAKIFEAPPPPPPEPPKERPPVLADANEIRHLIDEHSYEAFRSVLETMKKNGLANPDNNLAYAKAHGFATLAYGTANFPTPDLAKAVDSLKTLDLAEAQGGNPDLANLEILKARAALEIVTNSADTAARDLEGAFELNREDKELAYLLGLAKAASGDDLAALKAFDRAVVIDTGYAPALHAIGDAITKNSELGAPTDAAFWYEKAINAEPKHARSAVAAAAIYRAQKIPGAARRMLAAAANTADRGLPQDERAHANYSAAIGFQDADRAADGLKYAKEASRLDPGETRFAAAEAVALADAGKAKDALTKLEPILQREPKDVTLLIAEAQAHMKLSDIPKAFGSLEKAKKVEPRDQQIYLWEGRFNHQLGKLADARTAFTQSIQLSGGNDPRPMIALGRLEVGVGNVDGGLAQATAAVEASAGDPAAHTLLADCRLLRAELKLAMEAYQKSLELDPDNVDAQIGLANTLRDTGARAAHPSQSSELSQAIPIYIEAWRKNPDDARVMFEYGRALELQNKLDEALQLYRDAAALNAKDPRPHLAVVKAFLDQTNPDIKAARESLKKATELAPNSHEVKFWNARISFSEENYEVAERFMKSAVAAAPKNAKYRYWYGRVQEHQDSLFEAISEYERSIQLNSRFAPAYRSLAWAAISRNRYSKAEEYFDKFRKAAPDDGSIWVDIGQMWARQNRDSKAMRAFNTALKTEPNNAVALLQLGYIEQRRGNDAKALDYYYRAAQADSYNGEAVCQYAVTLARSSATPDKAAIETLKTCISMDNAPDELKRVARELLNDADVK